MRWKHDKDSLHEAMGLTMEEAKEIWKKHGRDIGGRKGIHTLSEIIEYIVDLPKVERAVIWGQILQTIEAALESKGE